METEYSLAFHYPSSGQEVILQACVRCLSVILNASFPHNCPDLDSQEQLNEDLTYLKIFQQVLAKLEGWLEILQ